MKRKWKRKKRDRREEQALHLLTHSLTLLPGSHELNQGVPIWIAGAQSMEPSLTPPRFRLAGKWTQEVEVSTDPGALMEAR